MEVIINNEIEGMFGYWIFIIYKYPISNNQ